ncbi:MAG: PHP domain-containing protein [Firmicutes bacterium]|nr:PHP domain-containing protein [Bacillota bacterium]
MDNFESLIKNYKMIFDHHTHTVYSHGKGSIEDNVKVAVSKGLKSIAITDHGPGHMTYGLKMSKVPEMRAEMDRLKSIYSDIDILLGVEANTMRVSPFLDVDEDEKEQFDIILAGYHYGITKAGMIQNYISDHTGLFKGSSSTLLVKNTDMILKALYENQIDILTHPGDKGPFDIEDIAKACADTKTMIEINGKHKHLTVDEIKIASKFDVKFVIGSDAHVPEKVGEFRPQLVRAFEAGLDPERIVNIERI